MTSKLDKIKENILPILQKDGVIRASFFGSFARGEEREDSDLDLLIEIPKGKSFLDVAKLKIKLEDSLSRDVDLVEYSFIKPILRKYILANQITIF